MVKAYLRYSLQDTFGLVCSFNGNIELDEDGKFAYAPALENVLVWNLKQCTLTKALEGSKAEVTALARSPDGKHLAVGHSDGSVRLWPVQETPAVCDVTLTGHRSAVTVVRYNADGSLLVSGSSDTDLVVWDVVAEAGLYRLRGHKDAITDVAFLEGRRQLVSASKDTLCKIWDVETQHCLQTLVGHGSHVTAIAVSPDQTRLLTAAADPVLRLWLIPPLNSSSTTKPLQGSTHGGPTARADGGEAVGMGGGEDAEAKGRVTTELQLIGTIPRIAAHRVLALRYHPSVPLVACLGADKLIEVFRIHDAAEVVKKVKRRRKRMREKHAGGAIDGAGETATGADVRDGDRDREGGATDDRDDGPASVEAVATDELSSLLVIRSPSKMRSMAFSSRIIRHPDRTWSVEVVVSLHNNTLEVYEIRKGEEGPAGGAKSACIRRIEMPGHRSDIRSLALSSDDALLASTSSSSLKLWNVTTRACIRSMDTGYGLCVLLVPGNKQVVVGTKAGTLELYDVAAAVLLEVVPAHSGPVWALALRPDRRGFASASADKLVKFWDLELVSDPVFSSTAKRLTVGHVRTLEVDEDVLSVRYTADGKLVAVALLDSTVKLFYQDSLNFYLSLYGHKLPVLSMDVSSDSELIATGSADKSVKIWGLDFGDCHRSLRAHDNSVTAVIFVPKTHYLFTASKDGAVKYWDVDKFELVLTLAGHRGPVWALAVSSIGDFVVSGSQDRSLRLWTQTDEQVFLEEERERRADVMFEAGLETQLADPIASLTEDRDAAAQEGDLDRGMVQSGRAGRMTADSIKAGERIIEAIELVHAEDARLLAYRQDLEEDRRDESSSKAPAAAPPPNVLLLGLAPAEYLLRTIKQVRSAELDDALLVVPFALAMTLLSHIDAWLHQGVEVELASRCLLLLVRVHHLQITATRSLGPRLLAVGSHLRHALHSYKEVIGYNAAALGYLERLVNLSSVKVFSGVDSKLAALRSVAALAVSGATRASTPGRRPRKRKMISADAAVR